jgi:hypothetical protein
MKFILAYNEEDLKFRGFYKEGIHNNIPSPNITITKKLWRELMPLGMFKIKNDITLDLKVYDINNIDIFEPIKTEQPKPEPTRMDFVEEQNAQFVMDIAIKDAKLEQLNNDYAQVVIDSALKDSEIEKLNQTVSEIILTVAEGGK